MCSDIRSLEEECKAQKKGKSERPMKTRKNGKAAWKELEVWVLLYGVEAACKGSF